MPLKGPCRRAWVTAQSGGQEPFPITASQSPEVLRRVTQAHDGMAGVYAAVLVEGTIRAGDPIEIVD